MAEREESMWMNFLLNVSPIISLPPRSNNNQSKSLQVRIYCKAFVKMYRTHYNLNIIVVSHYFMVKLLFIQLSVVWHKASHVGHPVIIKHIITVVAIIQGWDAADSGQRDFFMILFRFLC